MTHADIPTKVVMECLLMEDPVAAMSATHSRRASATEEMVADFLMKAVTAGEATLDTATPAPADLLFVTHSRRASVREAAAADSRTRLMEVIAELSPTSLPTAAEELVHAMHSREESATVETVAASATAEIPVVTTDALLASATSSRRASAREVTAADTATTPTPRCPPLRAPRFALPFRRANAREAMAADTATRCPTRAIKWSESPASLCSSLVAIYCSSVWLWAM